jgi:hypothetical protein
MATAITYNEIQALYLGLLDRPANAAGENFWYGNGTASSSSVAKEIGTYAQYYSGDNGLNGAAITSSNIKGEIVNLYTNMLGYTPSLTNNGVVYWSNVFNTDVTQGMTAGAAVGSITDQIFNIVENLPAGSPYINEKTTMDNRIATATAYTQANFNVTYSSSAYLAEGQTIITTPTMTTTNLTTTIDNIAPVGNTNIYGTLGTNSSAAGTGTDTLNPLDTIKATGSNNVLNITDQGYGLNESISTIASNHDFNFASVNVSGVQTLNIQAIYGETDLNVSGWTGLTALNLKASNGADGITAGTGTAVTLTDSKLTIGTTTVSGGSSINATVTGVTTGGAVNIGSSSTAGAITATVTDANTTVASITGSTITVAGGTIDNVTQNIAAAGSGLGTNTSTGGSITVNGGAATTSVSVTQTAPVTAVTGVAAVAQVDTLTYSGTASAGTTDSIIVNGTTYTASGLSTTATSTAVATAVAAAITAPGITVTHSAGVVTLTANVAGTPFTVAAGTDQTGITEVTATTAANVVAVTGVGGIADGTVAVNDANAGSTTAAGTITSVTLDNYGNSTISSNALSNLSLSDKGGTISITDALATPTATTLNLTVNNLSGTDTITDVNNEYKKLSITTGAKASTLTGINATGITSEIIGGSSLLTQTAAGMTNLATIAVNGGAGLTDSDLASISTLTSVTASSNASGIITVALNDTKTTFTGGSGQDIVTITSDATKAITGGSALNNEIVLNGTTFSLADTGTNVTHFSIAGFNSGSTAGSYDVSGDGSSIFGAGVINTIDLQSGFNTATTFTVAPSTALTIDGSISAAQVYEATGNSGLTDHVSITVGASGNATDLTVNALTLEDSASHGIGIVSLTSNDTGGSTGINTIVLTDNGMSALTINGAGGLTIATLTDNAATQTITDSGTGAVSITEALSSTLSNLTLSGAVGFTINGDTLTTGVTVAGGADNATVVLSLTGAAATYTDTVTLGNGNSDSVTISSAGAGTENITLGNGGTTIANENHVILTSSTATANIHVGTGVDSVTVGKGIDDVTFGSHTSTATLYDTLSLSDLATASFTPPTTASQTSIVTSGLDVITGLVAHDQLAFSANVTGVATAAADGLAGVSGDASFAHGTYSATNETFTYSASGTDTLVTFATDAGATTYDSIVLVGTSFVAPTISGHVVTLA